MQPPRTDEVARGIEKLNPETRQSGERQYLIKRGDRTSHRVTVPQGRKPLKPKTFKSICDQAGTTRDQMRALAACHKSRKDWDEWQDADDSDEEDSESSDDADGD